MYFFIIAQISEVVQPKLFKWARKIGQYGVAQKYGLIGSDARIVLCVSTIDAVKKPFLFPGG